MLHPDGSATVDLGGKSVLSCGLDKGSGFRLGIGDAASGEAYELRVGPFTLEGKGEVQEFDASDSVLAAELFDRRIARIEIAINGGLALQFVDGAVLRCKPQAEYEAWELKGPDGLLIVATAGGDSFGFWGPR